jgi:hypothetical protein
MFTLDLCAGDAMAESIIVCFRTSADFKNRIEDAARRKGQSQSTFLTRAALAAVRKAEAMPVENQKRVKGALPTYFRARCAEAKQGGSLGYQWAAYELARHLSEHKPDELDRDEWEGALGRLSEMLCPTKEEAPEQPLVVRLIRDDERELPDGRIVPRNDEAIWDWFKEYFPRCTKLVPRRRWCQFVAGIYRALGDGIARPD